MKDGGPAFPSMIPVNFPPHKFRDGDVPNPDLKISYAAFSGVTVRDYFAAKALAGYLAGDQGLLADQVHEADAIAFSMYQIADAMLKARK